MDDRSEALRRYLPIVENTMQGISIKGQELHEIQMPMVPQGTGVFSSLQYPKHRIQVERHDNQLILTVPGFLALELYRRSLLPQSGAEPVEIALSGKRLGAFVVVDIKYPRWDHESVRIVLQRS